MESRGSDEQENKVNNCRKHRESEGRGCMEFAGK